MLTAKLAASQQNIRARWDPHFSWIINESAPWAEPTKPLAEATVALLSTCGVYCADSQLPFDAWHDLGDPSFREIHVDTPADRLAIAHTHYEHIHVAADLGVAMPVAAFQRLVEAGTVGRLHAWMYSFMGYLPQARQLVNETAPRAARRLRAERVDYAFLTPC
jgi:hypothetical protein